MDSKLKRELTEEEIALLEHEFDEFYRKYDTDLNFAAKLIAAYVRNSMENFHSENLSDEQMKELNPIIRNAIFTALEDVDKGYWRAFFYAKFFIPAYWEDCEYIEKL